MSIRVLLVDDHAIMRKGLRLLLEKEPDIEVVGEAEDGLKALDLVRQLIPDIVITNINMPKSNGVDTTKQIVQEFPNIKVIALTMYSNRKIVINMLKAGASGYILKECLPKELVEAIRHVAAGGFAFCPYVAQYAVGRWLKKPSDMPDGLIDILTNRERHVLQFKCEGKNTRETTIEPFRNNKRVIEFSWQKIVNKLHYNHDSYTPITCISHSSE